MTLSERCANLYGQRPVQAFDTDYDSDDARERRAIIRQATGKADSLLQIQAIFVCGFIFGLLITPLPIAVGTFILLQLTEVHALIVYRAVYRAAQDPRASFSHFKGSIRRLSYSLAVAGGISLFLVYIVAPESWSLGVLAGCGVGAAYFIPFAKQNSTVLYTTLGIFHVAIFAAALARPFYTGGFSLEVVAAPLSLALFMMVTTIAIAVNVRIEYFKRLDDEELIEHSFTKLKAESRAKSILLARLSHEIRTPLNGILGGAELLRLKEPPDDQRALLEMMRESGANLVDLLNRTLEMSAAEVGALAISRTPEVLEKLISEEVVSLQSKAKLADVDLIMEDGFCDMPRQIDEVRTRQCIANLITNAIDHSKGDKVVVACEEATEDGIVVSVSDNGCGVPEHRRGLVFQPFGDKGLEGAYEGQGAGLGLALSRSIARAMGGDLALLDGRGAGSVFELRFTAPAV